jgi:FlaA1/EpsC-like NDP-sugar epimerase
MNNNRSRFRASKLVLADLLLTALAVLASFFLRLNLEQFFLDYLPAFFWMLLIALLIKPVVYRRMGLYERVWAYASMQEMKLIIKSVTVAAAVVGALTMALYWLGVFTPFAISLPVFDWLVSLAAIGGLRFGLRLLAENRAVIEQTSGAKLRRVLVVGAGDAGALVVRELLKNPRLGLAPIGYLDDDADKSGQRIHDVPVLGTLSDLAEQVRVQRAEEVVMAIPSAPGRVLRKVSDLTRAAGVPFRTMPGIYELIGGKVTVNRLREIDITDLLRRQPTQIDRKSVGDSLRGKRVLVTGAGGSIASELCRQIARWSPAQLTLLGHGENSIFEILAELSDEFPGLDIQPIIADIRNGARIRSAMAASKPDIVFHAAAHKHVPLMEANVPEAVSNNIEGTRNVVQAAAEAGVPRLIMISTDKAVRPASVMGATKRVAEWIVLDAASQYECAYSVVRFGNVLGSRGSVVPLFKQQIARGGPLTVTHPDMERFFMTIPEAVHLVLQASAFAGKGLVYMLEMGEPVKILDLATDLIRLSGLEPADIQIEFSGLRPGEKLSEQLWDKGAEYKETPHPDIRQVIEPDALTGLALTSTIEKLLGAKDSSAAFAEFNAILPGAHVGQTQPPDFKSIS